MTFAFDIDGVIVDVNKTVQQYLRKTHNLTYKQLGVQYIWPKRLSEFEGVFDEMIRLDIERFIFQSFDYIQDSIYRTAILSSMKTLGKQGHKIYIITNRPIYTKDVTRQCFPEDVAEHIEDFLFFEEGIDTEGNEDLFKIKRCQSVNVDVLIDDRADNIKAFAETTKHGFWFVDEIPEADRINEITKLNSVIVCDSSNLKKKLREVIYNVNSSERH